MEAPGESKPGRPTRPASALPEPHGKRECRKAEDDEACDAVDRAASGIPVPLAWSEPVLIREG